MSALISTSMNKDPDGLRRYTTRIKVLVHSHNAPDPIDLSDDVLSATVAKNIKGVGKCNIAVVANRSYLNMIYPNDYINVYFNIGDGNGWTRTFFGMVDRIEEEYKVDESGVPNTMYHVMSSDFTKVFEKTNIYFNPHLFDRADVAGEDYNALSNNIGGVQLQTRGIFTQGSPADCVINQIMIQIGFGAQWALPQSYPAIVEDRFANQRRDFARGRLYSQIENLLQPEGAARLRAIIEGEGLNAYQTDSEGNLTGVLRERAGEDLDSEDRETRVNAAIRAAGLTSDDLTPSDLSALGSAANATDMARALNNPRLRQELFGSGLSQGEQSFIYNNFLQYSGAEAREGTRGTFIDILNLFDFVERRAIDGYSFDMGIWERQGSMLSILRSLSNEPVNELFFDLRPMTVAPTEEDDPNVYISAGTNWDRTEDELSENTDYLQGEQNPGVRYMPSVIMREYPFSTIRSLDASSIPLRLRRGADAVGNLGVLNFGGVFSNVPNAPGRHMVTSDVLAIEEHIQGTQGSARTYKHLDVAVISETEIRSSRWGRSDAEHFNLFEMYTDNILGTDLKYYMYDFLPIITPVHIMRHGLRTKTVSTRFSRFPPAAGNRLQPQAESPEEEEEVTELSTVVIPPLAAHSSLRFTNRGGQRYGYRPRVPPYSSLNGFKFHNGVDIGADGPTASLVIQGMGNSVGPVDVVAIADGNIVASVAQGTIHGMNYYGNTIVIHHPQFSGPDEKPVFSLYAHLGHREPFTGNTDASTSLNRSANGEYLRQGGNGFGLIPVSRGQKIGSVGNTAGNRNTGTSRGDGPQAVFRSARAHLHFEIDYKIPPINNSAAPLIPIPTGGPTSPVPIGVNPNNTDPVAWFADQGVNLVEALDELRGSTVTTDPLDEADQEDAIDHDDPAPNPTRSEAQLEEDEVTQAQRGSGSSFRGTTDSIDARQQLGRWALMMDHWYQHNLEYVSGEVVMRPAPEIRVGYRLDIEERRMSLYVESVNHSWNFPNELQTTLQVTRGQPNNPYPAYALPPIPGFNMPPASRRDMSRLARYFIVPDPIAVRRAISIRDGRPANRSDHPYRQGNFRNVIDDPQQYTDHNYAEVADGANGLLPASSADFETIGDSLDEALGIDEREAQALLDAYGLGDDDPSPVDDMSGVSDPGVGTDGTTLGDFNPGESVG